MTTHSMTRSRAAFFGALVLAEAALFVSGCVENRCSSDRDCAQGWQCDLSSNRCIMVDAGDGGDASGLDGGDGDAEPECTTSVGCFEATAPICDATDLECRACGSDSECLDRDPGTPACAAPECVECTESAAHCDNPSPICEPSTNQCRACGSGAECVARNTALPACDGSSCVECTDSALHCGGTTPVCETSTNLCRACASHGDCDFAGGVCDGSTGSCLAESEVIYVDDDTCPQVGDGSRGNAYCSLQDGVDAVSGSRRTVLVSDGTYDEIGVQDAGAVWIVGGGSSVFLETLLNNTSIVYVSGTTTLELEGVTVRDAGGTGLGVECLGNVTIQPTVVLSGNTISGNSGGGVSASDCAATLSGNTISGNSGGGVSLSSSDATMLNNIIALNGSVTSAVGGVQIVNPVDTLFLHNTVVTNDAQFGEGGITCVQPVSIVSTLTYNNIGGDVSGNCSLSFSWTTADGDPQLDATYHLQPGSPCIDGGDPAAVGLPTHDIDGDPRVLGGLPDIGADERQ